MASRWPTDILTIGTRRVWGRIFAISIDADTVDALGDPLILSGDAGRTNTASASIRGTARVGDKVTAPDGRGMDGHQRQPAGHPVRRRHRA